MGDVLAAAGLLLGAGFAVVAAVGLHRFPDVFTRMHAATKPATLGLVLVNLTAAAWIGETDASVKLLLVVVLQLLTAPVGAHMVARAAYRHGRLLSERTAVDELADAGALPGPDQARGNRGGGVAGRP